MNPNEKRKGTEMTKEQIRDAYTTGTNDGMMEEQDEIVVVERDGFEDESNEETS